MTKGKVTRRRFVSAARQLFFAILLAGCIADAPTPAAPPQSTPTGAWYQLMFTDPEATAKLDNPRGGIPDALIATFNAARQTIDVAVYEIDWRPLADALIAAHQRGVRVRVVTDSDYLDEEAAQAIVEAGIPVVGDERSPFMHNKFVVVDSAVVWAGSMNFTRNDAYRNDNNMIEILSSQLARNYTAQFERMFVEQRFAPAVTPPHPTLTLNGTLIENYFSPDTGVADKILDVLQTARASIHFLAFSFTRQDFTDAMIERAQAGVTVQGVFEKRQVSAGADQAWQALTGAGLDVRLDGNAYTMHNKVIIVDGQIVITGSYNFSANAEEQNDENILIIHHAEIAAAYEQAWQRVWLQASP